MTNHRAPPGHVTAILTPDWLRRCRSRCSELLRGESPLAEEVRVAGGLGDTLTDPFGFRLNICAEDEGFNEDQRQTFVEFNVNIDETLPYIPRFTEHGFEKTRIPEDLYHHLLQKLQEQDHPDNWVQETMTAPGVINNQVIIEHVEGGGEKEVLKFARSKMLGLSSEEIQLSFRRLGPLAELWAGVRLRPTSIYGIRRYVNNSALISHIDK